MEMDIDGACKPKGIHFFFVPIIQFHSQIASSYKILNFIVSVGVFFSKKETEGEEEKGKPIVAILVGAPGSGKSTFCENVMRASSRPWVRICQVSLFICLIFMRPGVLNYDFI